jgi:transposase
VEANKKLMNQKYFIGIDISKGKLDCAVILSDYTVVAENSIPNNVKKIKSFLKGFIKKHNTEFDQILVCCESTGIYNGPLRQVCSDLNIGLWEEHALKIKRASTDMRGKSDRKDAMRIAEYLVRYRDKALLYKQPSDVLKTLDQLNKVRETLLGSKLAFENQLGESKSFDPDGYKVLLKHYKQLIAQIESQLKKIDLEIQEQLNQHEDIQQNINLMKGVPGVGKQTALQLIIYTQNFTAFKSVKHLACYAGVVPFQNESGIVIKRARVSKMASKKLKSVLHMAALAAVRTKSELKAYYIRKIAEGKNKMCVLNAVRNKILQRIWAVVERQTPFLSNENFRPI